MVYLKVNITNLILEILQTFKIFFNKDIIRIKVETYTVCAGIKPIVYFGKVHQVVNL